MLSQWEGKNYRWIESKMHTIFLHTVCGLLEEDKNRREMEKSGALWTSHSPTHTHTDTHTCTHALICQSNKGRQASAAFA